MKEISFFCDRCNKDNVIWFKSKDHYLDLKKGENNYYQFEIFSEELKKSDLKVKEINYKSLKVKHPNGEIIIHRHECGPEILFDISKILIEKVPSYCFYIGLIIRALKKLTEKKAKKRKEKPIYAVYFFQDHNRIKINSFDKDSIFKAAKRSYQTRRS